MPTWLKCRNCGKDFYTATSEYNIDREERCQNCQGNLVLINRMVEKVLSKGQNLELYFQEEGKKFQGELDFITEDELSIKNGDDIEEILSGEYLLEGEECRASFSCRGAYSGRYYFDTEFLSLSREKKEDILLATPDYLVRRQERKDIRFSSNVPVKYRIAESLEELETGWKNFSVQGYQTGKALNISSSGMLLADEKQFLSRVGENHKVVLKVEQGQYNFSLQGRVARVSDLTELEKDRRNEHFPEENYLGLGIQFLELKDESYKQLEKFKLEKL